MILFCDFHYDSTLQMTYFAAVSLGFAASEKQNDQIDNNGSDAEADSERKVDSARFFQLVAEL